MSLLVGLAISLAACGGQAPTPTVAPSAAPSAAPAAATPTTKAAQPTAIAPTAVKAAPTSVSAQPSGPAKLDPAGACKVAAAPKPAANFPASLPTDQMKGSDKAAAVLYEYSDFQ
jgi:ParB family chromosome partitioning protein